MTGPHESPVSRRLTVRHIQFIAIGGAVGAGLFLGSGAGIMAAGPAILVSYGIAGIVIFLMARALGEMALARPIAGSFSTYAEEYLGRWAGFVTGWSYWLIWVLVGIAELTAAGIFVRFWFPEVPQWVPALVALICLYGINCMAVRAFGELEFWMSLIKVLTILALIIGGLAIIVYGSFSGSGAGSWDTLIGHGGFAPKGWLAALVATPVAIFAFGGIELIGLMAAEAEDPERALPRAINGVALRILIFYVGSLAVIMLLLPWPSVTAGASPYVLAFEQMGFRSAAGIINLVVLTAVLSSCNSGLFATGQMLSALAARGYASSWLSVVGRQRRPTRAITVSAGAMLIGVALNYFVPDAVLAAVMSAVAILLLWTWSVITLSHWVYRRRNGAGRFPMPFYPLSSYLVIAVFVAVIASIASDPASRPMLIVTVIWFAVLSLYFLLMLERRKQ